MEDYAKVSGIPATFLLPGKQIYLCTPPTACRLRKAFFSSLHAFNQPTVPSAALSCQEVLLRIRALHTAWCNEQRACGAVSRV